MNMKTVEAIARSISPSKILPHAERGGGEENQKELYNRHITYHTTGVIRMTGIMEAISTNPAEILPDGRTVIRYTADDGRQGAVYFSAELSWRMKDGRLTPGIAENDACAERWFDKSYELRRRR